MIGEKMLKKAIIGTLVRRVMGYLGVAGMVGFQDDVTQIVGAAGALVTLLWSLYGKVKAYREN